MLIGHASRDIDANLLRENWEKNYPVRRIDGLPDFVEVTAGKKNESMLFSFDYDIVILYIQQIFVCSIQRVMYIKLLRQTSQQ